MACRPIRKAKSLLGQVFLSIKDSSEFQRHKIYTRLFFILFYYYSCWQRMERMKGGFVKIANINVENIDMYNKKFCNCLHVLNKLRALQLAMLNDDSCTNLAHQTSLVSSHCHNFTSGTTDENNMHENCIQRQFVLHLTSRHLDMSCLGAAIRCT